jgi:inositol-pentakisphosphate 2-kinase
MPDATTFVDSDNIKTVCVEIKPKFGAVLKCDSVAVEHRHLKHVHSRYQLHQSLKMQQGVIQEKSMYDPLDLFSRDGVRMERAIMALLENPQNNLCLFIGGKRISDILESCSFDAAHRLLCRGDCEGGYACLARTISKILLQEGILDDILALQTKCKYDVQEIERRLNGLLMAGNGTEESLLSDHGAPLDVLADYCISATAKDCSIMITMAPRHRIESRIQGAKPCENGVVDIGSQDTCIEYRVTVVDLDRKSLGKIKSHAKLDRDIIEANLR